MNLESAETDNYMDSRTNVVGWSDVSSNNRPKWPSDTFPMLSQGLSRIPAFGQWNMDVSEQCPGGIISLCIQPDESPYEVSYAADGVGRRNQEMLVALARAVDVISPWTANHSKRVADLAVHIGSFAGLAPKELDVLWYAALLHDIGKLGISTSILEKPGKLNKDERRCVEQHPHIGASILGSITSYRGIVPIVLQHHERFNGAGYPHGLSGDAICLDARILAVADVYDALASKRPYRVGRRQKSAVAFIKRESGRKFDPDVVEVFLEVMEQKKKVRYGENSERILDIAFPFDTPARALVPINFSKGGSL